MRAVRACGLPPSGFALLPASLIRLIFWMAAPSPAISRRALESMKVDELICKLKSLDQFAYKSCDRLTPWLFSNAKYKEELLNDLQRVLASKHWPRDVVVTGAGEDNINGVYELTDCKNLAKLSRWFRIPGSYFHEYAGISDIIWLKRDDDHSSSITYIRPRNCGAGVNRWGISTVIFGTPSSGFGIKCMRRRSYYVTRKNGNVCQHPFDLSRQTLSWETIDNPDIEPVPNFSTVYKYERRAWGLALGLIMTPLTRKFGLTTLHLSAPDAMAYRWCLQHYGGGIDVKSLQGRWKRSRAKTWIALVAGGNG